jgi:hypothetical protein
MVFKKRTKMGSHMSPATEQIPLERRLEREGAVFATPSELREFFDRKAMNLGVSSSTAIERIESGDFGSDLAWQELALLYLLL